MKGIVQWARSLWPFGDYLNFPERRSSRRYLTLKNAALALPVLIVAFILLSLWSAWRPSHSGASVLGSRAASSELPAVDREPFAIVGEGSTSDYPRDGSILNDDVPLALAPPAVPKETIALPEPQPPPPPTNGQRITISGGSKGVHLQVETAPASTPRD